VNFIFPVYSEARQNNKQLVVDLGTGIYWRTRKIRAFNLPDYL